MHLRVFWNKESAASVSPIAFREACELTTFAQKSGRIETRVRVTGRKWEVVAACYVLRVSEAPKTEQKFRKDGDLWSHMPPSECICAGALLRRQSLSFTGIFLFRFNAPSLAVFFFF